MMGSGAETAHETVDWLVARGEKVGVLKVRLYRPFAVEDFVARAARDRPRDRGARPHQGAGRDRRPALPGRDRRAARAPRTKAPQRPRASVIGGRYGLSSKEFTPAMVRGGVRRACEGQAAPPLHRRHRRRRHRACRCRWIASSTSSPTDVVRAVFYGLGADGTVGANKNSIKIIGEETDHYAQGYFVYDSKKSGAITISHLRFGPRPIRSSYLIRRAELRRRAPVRLPRALRRARAGGAGRHAAAQLAVRARQRSGTSCRARCRSSIIEQELQVYVDRRPRGRPARPAWAGASTP